MLCINCKQYVNVEVVFADHEGVWSTGATTPLIHNFGMIWGSGQLHYTALVGPEEQPQSPVHSMNFAAHVLTNTYSCFLWQCNHISDIHLVDQLLYQLSYFSSCKLYV